MKISAIKNFLGIGKSAMNSAKEAAAVSNPVKTVADSSVKNMQDAAAAYGKADVALANGKKVYQKPDTKVHHIDNKDTLMATSGYDSSTTPDAGDDWGAKQNFDLHLWDEEPASSSKSSVWDSWDD